MGACNTSSWPPDVGRRHKPVDVSCHEHPMIRGEFKEQRTYCDGCIEPGGCANPVEKGYSTYGYNFYCAQDDTCPAVFCHECVKAQYLSPQALARRKAEIREWLALLNDDGFVSKMQTASYIQNKVKLPAAAPSQTGFKKALRQVRPSGLESFPNLLNLTQDSPDKTRFQDVSEETSFAPPVQVKPSSSPMSRHSSPRIFRFSHVVSSRSRKKQEKKNRSLNNETVVPGVAVFTIASTFSPQVEKATLVNFEEKTSAEGEPAPHSLTSARKDGQTFLKETHTTTGTFLQPTDTMDNNLTAEGSALFPQQASAFSPPTGIATVHVSPILASRSIAGHVVSPMLESRSLAGQAGASPLVPFRNLSGDSQVNQSESSTFSLSASHFYSPAQASRPLVARKPRIRRSTSGPLSSHCDTNTRVRAIVGGIRLANAGATPRQSQSRPTTQDEQEKATTPQNTTLQTGQLPQLELASSSREALTARSSTSSPKLIPSPIIARRSFSVQTPEMSTRELSRKVSAEISSPSKSGSLTVSRNSAPNPLLKLVVNRSLSDHSQVQARSKSDPRGHITNTNLPEGSEVVLEHSVNIPNLSGVSSPELPFHSVQQLTTATDTEAPRASSATDVVPTNTSTADTLTEILEVVEPVHRPSLTPRYGKRP
eukprot:gb/GEZN01004342.1/.p1 GENE.gb/GEZN01004342.1/~~gb/GEZN01004342.1/.p1  ORF type:complete len:654 (+),score=54.01 gb/GEZN01004342.1/:22-1983(+)